MADVGLMFAYLKENERTIVFWRKSVLIRTENGQVVGDEKEGFRSVSERLKKSPWGRTLKKHLGLKSTLARMEADAR